jgi:predicted Holliday junction resolvase-like endonuclease
MLYLLDGMLPFRNLESEIRNLRAKTDSVSKQLGAWARTLQDSGLKGRRYVNEKTRRATEQAREREEFLKKLEEIRKGGHAESAIKNPEPRSNNPESGSS